jgi:predicted branched-subunit amino acid permease
MNAPSSPEHVDTTRTQAVSAARPWVAGARQALPFVLAFAPYGWVIGAVADRAAVDDVLGWSTAWLVYAGTSQLVSIQSLESGSPVVVLVAVVLLVNARMVAYAASLSPTWRTAPWWWTAVASYLLIDPAYLIGTEQEQSGPTEDPAVLHRRRAHYLGAAATLWITWLVNCALGVVLGGRLTAFLPAAVIAELMLGCIVALLISSRATRVAAVTGFTLGLPAALLPSSVGAPVAALLAIGVAVRVKGESR